MSRIRLHKHLFSSLLLHAIISALLKWHLLHSTFDRSESESGHEFHHQPATSSTSSVSSLRMPSLCLVLSVLLRYFRSTNYLWMFNEALYLHQLIKHAFSQPSLRPFIILGYSLPFVTTTSYIFARYLSTTSNLASVEDSSLDAPPYDFNAQFSSNLDQNLPSLSPLYASAGPEQFSPLSRNSQQQQQQFALYHQQLNDQVHHALSTLVRLPAIRQHLTMQQETAVRGPDSVGWLNDLWAAGGGAGGGVGAGLAERLVAEDVTGHKSSLLSSASGSGKQSSVATADHDSGQRVLDNLEALEDASSSLVEEDNCWLMPSYESWHEWIINVPNLAILIVSISLFFFLSGFDAVLLAISLTVRKT